MKKAAPLSKCALLRRLRRQQADLGERGVDRLLGRLGQRRQRQAALRAVDHAEPPSGIFHRRRVGLDEQRVVQRHQRVVQLAAPSCSRRRGRRPGTRRTAAARRSTSPRCSHGRRGR